MIGTNGEKKISRDEMNLAEFPLAVLSTRADPKIKTLEFQDHVIGKDGHELSRSWIITGADKFGLPTASDDEVLLGLMKLTVDNGFREKKVKFTRYELLRILEWSTEGRSYTRLQNAFDRLSGVRIKAMNAFYDNEMKSHSTKNFGIIDAYEINDGREQVKPSFFIWSEELFKSFQAGFIKKLDLDFLLQLRSAVSKRLYRYLDKHFWYRSRVQQNLFVLAHEKIGISRNYKFASSLKQQLEPAIAELKEAGFLGTAEYLGKGSGTEIVLTAARGRPRAYERLEEGGTSRAGQRPADSLGQLDFKVDSSADRSVDPLLDRAAVLAGALAARGIARAQAERLLNTKDLKQLDKIEAILGYFDQLLRSKSRLVSKSPAGFLYRAVERSELFVLPGLTEKEPGSRAERPKNAVREAKSREQSKRHAEYLAARREELLRLQAYVEPEVEQRVRREVEQGLAKVKGLISAARFTEAVAHGVEERLLRLFAFPDYEDWSSR